MSGHDDVDTTAQPSRIDTTEPEADGAARLKQIVPDDTDPFLPNLEDEEDSNSETEQSRPNLIWEITETLVLALLIFVAVRSFVLNFRVDGLSMEPTLDSGEMLLVNRQIYFHFDANNVLSYLPFVERESENIIYPLHPPQRGDIIVFDPPIGRDSKPYIKRVIGLPGESVTIHDGNVYIDGRPLDEPYLRGTATSWPNGDPNRELVVPEGSVFVLGDNRNNSTDSRSFGPVPIDAIIGKAWIAYWPSSVAGIINTPDYFH